MVGDCRVADLGWRQLRHVTRNAIVLRILHTTIVSGERATLLSVAFQASLLIIANTFGRFGHFVWIVARDTAKLTITRLITTTGLHLLDMPDGPKLSRYSESLWGDVNELFQGEAGAIIE